MKRPDGLIQKKMDKTIEKSQTEQFKFFLEELEGKKKVEERLRLCIDFMKSLLTTDSTPVFRDFWEAKRLCLELFKEKIPPRSRSLFWGEYVELSDEMRRVKEVLDEQSTFAHEQIELAVDAFEGDLKQSERRLEDMPDIEIPKGAKTLQPNLDTYVQLQKELDLFSTFSGRLNALRKELVQTQMRVRQKNRLFQRLSSIGDRVFPRRKQLVKEISELFAQDVQRFIDGFQPVRGPFFDEKEEIKSLQSFAKLLSLNSKTFSKIRESLSSCWDRIREKEKEHQDKRAEEREKDKEHLEKFLPQIEALKEESSSESLSVMEARQRADAISKEMREVQLGRDTVKHLKKLLSDAMRPVEEKADLQRKERIKRDEDERQRREGAIESLLQNSGEILDQAEALPTEALVEKWEALVKEEKGLAPSGYPKALLENRIESIFDHIQEKKWQTLSERQLSELDGELHALLEERHKARRSLKSSLEEHRKIVGGSSLDFEASMHYQELIGDQKNRLDTMETMIEEIEEKLFDVEE